MRLSNVTVGRYSNPETRRSWLGWIEPEDKSWIAFVDADHRPHFFLERDPETGAVLD